MNKPIREGNVVQVYRIENTVIKICDDCVIHSQNEVEQVLKDIGAQIAKARSLNLNSEKL